MEAPLAFKGYALLRRTFSPNRRTARYLVFESVLLFALVAAGFAAAGIYTAIPVAFFSGAALLGMRLGFIPRENWTAEPHVLDVTLKEVVVMLTATVAYAAFVQWRAYGPFVGEVSVHVLPVAVFAVYWLFIWMIGAEYGNDRQFHTNDYSANWDTWAEASLTLEKGLDHYDEGRRFEAFHKLGRAKQMYEDLQESEDRRSESEAARWHAEAAAEFEKAAYDDPRHRHIHYNLADEFLDHAEEELSKRRCDGCGDRFNRGDVVRFLDDANHLDSLRCESCAVEYQNRTRAEQGGEDTSSSETETEETTETSKTSKTSETAGRRATEQNDQSADSSSSSSARSGTTSSTSNETGRRGSRKKSNSRTTTGDTASSSTRSEEPDGRRRSRSNNQSRNETDGAAGTSTDDEMTVDDARDVLDLEEPFDSEDLTRAYKLMVKESHPDAGGSDEEFIRVKEAQDTLQEYLRKNR